MLRVARPAMSASVVSPHIDPDLAAALARGGLTPLRLGGRVLLPIVQGGMGVGISAHSLAGSVAALGGVGTISSVDLRRLHPDLLERTLAVGQNEATKAVVDAANLEALEREIAAARELAQGRGLLAINVMRAVGEYAPSVKKALECGIDAVVVGAGLPLDLPDLAKDHPQALLVPILSDARGVALVVKKWERKKRLPDAIVIEHPRLAGGHLGAAKVADLGDPRFDFENVIPQSLAFLRSAGIEREIPLIAAGGVRSFGDIARLQALGAAAVQLGTPFAVTARVRRAPQLQEGAGRGAGLRHGRVHERRRPACTRGGHAVAAQLPEVGGPAAACREGQAALPARVRLPGAVRPARWHERLGPVLHRHPPGCSGARRHEAGPVLPRRRRAALRQPDPQRARADASPARRTCARRSGNVKPHTTRSQALPSMSQDDRASGRTGSVSRVLELPMAPGRRGNSGRVDGTHAASPRAVYRPGPLSLEIQRRYPMNDLTAAQTDKLMADLRLVVADAEELLRTTAGQAGEGAAELRAKVQDSLARARDSLLQAQDVAISKAKAAGRAADDYVHDNPWRSIGIAAGFGLVVGLLIGRR